MFSSIITVYALIRFDTALPGLKYMFTSASSSANLSVKVRGGGDDIMMQVGETVWINIIHRPMLPSNGHKHISGRQLILYTLLSLRQRIQPN